MLIERGDHVSMTKRWADQPGEEKRFRRDTKTLYAMAQIYCSAHHAEDAREKDEQGLCPDCAQAIAYSIERTRVCPREHQGNCEDCPIHCYKPEQRQAIREIMAFAGPRMLTRHPVLTYFYLKKKLKNKRSKSS